MKRKNRWIVICSMIVACSVSGVGLSAGIWQEGSAIGCKVWNAYPEPGETFTWDGPCKDGFVDGSGILEWFLNGKFKVRYEGMVVAGKREGKATMHYADGRRYVGDFLGSERTGKGILYLNNGDRYEGDFVNGRLHGQGKYFDAKGKMTYQGRWDNGKYVGP